MKIEFEQLFYGRGDHGYGVLEASPGGQRFTARVEALCGGVGTPDGGYGGAPFLLSVPEGEWVVMVCGRRGASDSMGRGTLFFHALVAKEADLKAAGVDGFSLFAQGAFAERVPDDGTGSVRIDVQRDGESAVDCDATAFPVAIRSGRPEPEAVRSLAGGQVNALRWATYTFQQMPGFDLQVLPLRTALPPGTNEYDAEGRLVQAAVDGGAAKCGAVRGAGTGVAWVAEAPDTNLLVANKPQRSLLALSFALNTLLAVACAALWLTRPGGGTGNRAEIERDAVGRYRAELAEEFPQGERIQDWDTEVAQALGAWYEDIMDNEKPDAKRFLSHASNYVDFVKRHNFDNTQTKEKNP